MLRERKARYIDKPLSWASWLAALGAAIIAATLKADTSSYSQWPLFLSGITFLRGSAWWTLPATTIVAAGSQQLRSRIGSRYRWKTVQVLVDHYREETFGKNEHTKDDPLHFHRVTIFKQCRWRLWFVRWPWSGWMIPVVRSNYATKSRISCFRASLDDPYSTCGIAGQAFVSCKRISVSDLPDLCVPQTTDDDFKRYAERTFVTTEVLRDDPPSSRSLLGIPIELNGTLWGSIVLDSQNPRQIYFNKPVHGALAKALNEILRNT